MRVLFSLQSDVVFLAHMSLEHSDFSAVACHSENALHLHHCVIVVSKVLRQEPKYQRHRIVLKLWAKLELVKVFAENV